MAEFTPNYNLEKPAGAEKYYISKFNANADKIDEALKGHDDTIAANKTQEQQDIADTKEYADNAVSAHNSAEGDNVHPYLQRKITEAANKALADAKDYAYSKVETDERISVHNSDESAHQDIRNLINGMGTTVQTDIENAIAVHNASPEAHPDIRTDYANYTNNVVSTHNNDPEAHGGKDVVYTKLAAMGNGFTSSMTHADILTAFQDGKNVVALLNSGGEVQLETDGANITGKRTVIEGDKMVLETYVLNPETNMFTKTSTKYLLDYAPAIADEAIADVSIIVDPESDDEAAKIGSAIIGQSRIGGGTAMGGADWNAQEGEAGYIANKPFGETVLYDGNINIVDNSGYYGYKYPKKLKQNTTYEVVINENTVTFTSPKAYDGTIEIEMPVGDDYDIYINGNEMYLWVDGHQAETVYFKLSELQQIDEKYLNIDEDYFKIVEGNGVSPSVINDAVNNNKRIIIKNYLGVVFPIDGIDEPHKRIYYTNIKNNTHCYIDYNSNDDNSCTWSVNYEIRNPIICYIKDTKKFYTLNNGVAYGTSLGDMTIVNNMHWIRHNKVIYVYESSSSSLADAKTYYLNKVSGNNYTYVCMEDSAGSNNNNTIIFTKHVLTINVSSFLISNRYTVNYSNMVYAIQTNLVVTFMATDGTSTISQSTITNGVPDSIPDAPTKTDAEGYTYAHIGWNTTKNATTTIPLENITSSTTVYAVYSKTEVKEITDDWDTIIGNIDNKTYKSKYKLGNYKPLDLGTEGTINMQIVGMDTDKNESDTKVPITFIGMELLNTSHRMNPTYTAGTEGTGTLGGWEKSEMRTYLNDTILPLIPSNVKRRINAVKKISNARDVNETAFQQTTYDKLWIPGDREIFNSTAHDTDGPSYSDVFKDKASRIKKRNSSDDYWWLRSAYDRAYFYGVKTAGTGFSDNSSDAKGVCLGFSLGAEQETITDDWSAISASAKDGSYKTKYSIGDTKFVDLGSEGVHLMQLVAFDSDDKADGSGKAPMTWVMKDLLKTTHRMNPDKVDGQEGTGTLGGYDKTEMKSYLIETILPLVPSDIKNNIVPVTKHQKAFDASGNAFQQTTTETLWIPGHKEIFNDTTYDTDGSAYSDVFKDATSRIKNRNGSAVTWWLRSASSTTSFRSLNYSGNDNHTTTSSNYGVCPGFCM